MLYEILFDVFAGVFKTIANQITHVTSLFKQAMDRFYDRLFIRHIFLIPPNKITGIPKIK
jgi:hypothetical protein